MYDINAGKLVADARARCALSQRELAERSGTSQSAIARLESGATRPTLATLERTLAAAGFALRCELVPLADPDPVVALYKKDVDRTLLRANLACSVDERLRSLEEHQAFGREVQRAVAHAKTCGP